MGVRVALHILAHEDDGHDALPGVCSSSEATYSHTTYTVTGPANNPTVTFTWTDTPLKKAGSRSKGHPMPISRRGLTPFQRRPQRGCRGECDVFRHNRHN